MDVYYVEEPEIDKNALIAVIFLVIMSMLTVDIPLLITIDLPIWIYAFEIVLFILVILFLLSLIWIRKIMIYGDVLEIKFGVFTSKTKLRDVEVVEFKNPPLPALVPGVGYMFNYLIFAFNPTKRFIRIKRRRGLVRDIYFTSSNEYQLITIIEKILEKRDDEI